MPRPLSPSSSLFLGIDGGGSKCRALLTDGYGSVLGQGIAGAANPFQDFVLARKSIVKASLQALENAGLQTDLRQVTAGVGLAGVNVPACRAQVASWHHPFAKMFLTSDLHIACLGAHSGRDGAVLVVGTGSCAYARVAGQNYSYGGHGFPVGDQGSGAWIGMRAVQAALLAADKLGADTCLLAALCRHFDTDAPGMVGRVANATSQLYAQLAPLVIKAADDGDVVAAEIVEEGVEYLVALTRNLQRHKPPAVALLGGLGPKLQPRLEAHLAGKFVEAILPPEAGAAMYARQLARTGVAAA